MKKLYEELLIDGKSTKTKHPLIYKARENFINPDILFKELRNLKKHLDKHDYDSTLQVLTKLIPEWDNNY